MNKISTKLSYLLITLVSVSLLTSCDNDSKKVTSEKLIEKTYSGVNELNLDYCGYAMPGKSVTFIPAGNDGTLSLESKLNPGELISALSKFPEIQGPGVIPGSPVFNLPVSLNSVGGKYGFSGKGENEYLTFDYDGDIDSKSLDLSITNARLKDTSLAGTVWTPAPVKTADGILPVESPLHIVWDTSSPVDLGDIKMSPQEILQLLANLPLISVYNGTAKMSVAEALCQVVKTMAFLENGNIVFMYVNTANGAAQLMTAPRNMIQYVVAAPGIIKIFPNPVDIYSQYLVNQPQKPHPGVSFGKNASRTDTGAIFELEEVINIIKAVLPMISEGFPMQYTVDGSDMAVYFNNDFLIPLLKGLVPVMSNPLVRGIIFDSISAMPELEPYMPVIKSALTSLPAMIEGTSKLELGLNLKAYKN